MENDAYGKHIRAEYSIMVSARKKIRIHAHHAVMLVVTSTRGMLRCQQQQQQQMTLLTKC